MYTKIIGTGSYLPEQVRTNADLEKMVDTSDEWIVTRTGIRERHIAAPNETVSTMGFEAATRAIEMAGIYSGVLSGTTEAVASVISNNLNIVMKLLTTMTIVLSIPTMVSSFYGMNVRGLPFAEHPYGFWIVIVIAVIISLLVAIIFSKKDLF